MYYGRNRRIVLLTFLVCSIYVIQPSTSCQTVGGPDPYRQCVFPFRWNGKTYYGCPIDPDDSSHRWCSTKVDGYGNHVTGRGKYGHCSRSCPKHQSGRPYRPAPIKNCNDYCTFDYTPVCGSDGKTYSNACALEVEACKTNSNLYQAYRGECRGSNNRPTPTYIVGRPFIVEGKSKTTMSKICNLENCQHSTSWKMGTSPNVSNNHTYNSEIGLEWLKQAEAEHASVASFSRHTLQLMSIGAPSNLLTASQKASVDEIKHAKMCYTFASAFIGRDVTPGKLDVESSLQDMDIQDIIRSVIQEGCIEETLSAIEAHFRAFYTRDPVIKSTLSQIASDETRHAQLAWDTIKWITEKYPETQTLAKKYFYSELNRQQTLLSKKMTSLPSAVCNDPTKDDYLKRYGILVSDDQEKIRKFGIQKIIEPTYYAGFEQFDSLSESIENLDILAI